MDSIPLWCSKQPLPDERLQIAFKWHINSTSLLVPVGLKPLCRLVSFSGEQHLLCNHSSVSWQRSGRLIISFHWVLMCVIVFICRVHEFPWGCACMRACVTALPAASLRGLHYDSVTCVCVHGFYYDVATSVTSCNTSVSMRVCMCSSDQLSVEGSWNEF